MTTELEREIGITLAEFLAMDSTQVKALSDTLNQTQIREFNKLVRQAGEAKTWKQRNEGTFPLDVDVRADIMARITESNDKDTLGHLFEEYINTYPINVNPYIPQTTVSLGAYGGVLNFGLLDRALNELCDQAFDKFGMMLEYIQQFAYLTPTHGMIASAMRDKMPEFKT